LSSNLTPNEQSDCRTWPKHKLCGGEDALPKKILIHDENENMNQNGFLSIVWAAMVRLQVMGDEASKIDGIKENGKN